MVAEVLDSVALYLGHEVSWYEQRMWPAVFLAVAAVVVVGNRVDVGTAADIGGVDQSGKEADGVED